MTKVVFVNLYEFNYLGTRLLAAYLQQHGFATHNILLEDYRYDIVDIPDDSYVGYHFYMFGNFYEHHAGHIPLESKDFKLLQQALIEEAPNIIGFSSRSTFNYLVPLLVPVFKKACPDSLLVAGGFGPTLDPAIYLNNGFDVVVRGDGEEAMLEIAQCVHIKDLKKIITIQNTVWSEKWGAVCNPLRNQEKNLSKYCAPLHNDKYFSYIIDGEIVRNTDPILRRSDYYTYFGRGCIGTCSYCSGGQWSNLYYKEHKKAYKRRNRTLDDIFEELTHLPASIKYIVFCDEYWALPESECIDFFIRYKKDVGLEFFAYLSYEQMMKSTQLFELVLSSGLRATGIGFQSGSQRILRNLYNRRQDNNLLVKYAQKLFDNFVTVNTQFIGGNCYETEEDFLETIKLIRLLPFSLEDPFCVPMQSTQLVPHPHTPLREIAPDVVSKPMPSKLWAYRAILGEFARIIDEDEFSEIYHNNKFKENPQLLAHHFRNKLSNLRYAYYTRMVETASQHDWIFYGNGPVYREMMDAHRDILTQFHPRAILVDREYLTDERYSDGVPVICAEDFLASNEPNQFHYFIFAGIYFEFILSF